MKKILYAVNRVVVSILAVIIILGCSTSNGQAAPQNTAPQVLFKVTFGGTPSADPGAPHRPQGWGKMTYDPKSGNLLYDWEVDGKQYHGVFEPRNKFTARISGELVFDPQTRIFTYTYRVNDLAGPQSIGIFYFENQAEIIENSNNVNWSIVMASPSNSESRFVSVGNPIAPGQTGVFVLKSLAPPGIVLGKLKGMQIQPYVGDAIGDRVGNEPLILHRYRSEIIHGTKFEYQQFHMPAPAPVPEMTAGQFVDRLIALKNQSVAYQWLNAGLSTQLDALLQPVKQAAYGSGDLQAAVTKALARLEDLKKSQSMKNKLYMLIKGNLLYLTGLNRLNEIYVPRYPTGF